jgi:hypothetical protein
MAFLQTDISSAWIWVRGQLMGSLSKQRLLVAQRDPQASKTFQNNAPLGVSNDLDCALAFGCFVPGVYAQHRAGSRSDFIEN